MPRHDDAIPLRHMLDHAREAVSMITDKTSEDLGKERILELAIVRLVEIVGEAAGRVSQQTQAKHPGLPWREVIGMRNRLIHGYDSIDLDVLWHTIESDLPPLISQLETILSEVKTIRPMNKLCFPYFNSYIGIDYSGAETPTSSLKGLRVYLAHREALPMEVQPPPSPRKYWTRRGIAEWLVERLGEEIPTLVGIDHGFSFPLRYFEVHHLAPDWPTFLDDFQRHWPTNDEHTYVDFIRHGTCGNGGARSGNSRWRRLTEERAGAAKSVFHFDVPGSVAKSTHAGLPWLRYLRQMLGDRIHFWPFDGWRIPPGRSTVAEVYPSLWSRSFARENRTSDQHDAYAAAAWLRQTDLDGGLTKFLAPSLSPGERAVARIEGWILGVL